jgi:hypothetical protein
VQLPLFSGYSHSATSSVISLCEVRRKVSSTLKTEAAESSETLVSNIEESNFNGCLQAYEQLTAFGNGSEFQNVVFEVAIPCGLVGEYQCFGVI